MDGQPKKSNWVQLVSYLVIVFLLIETIFLVLQNRELKEKINNLTKTPETLKAGEQVEPFEVQLLDSTRSRITYSDTSRKYLFFVFSTTCPYCEKNIEHWNSIIKKGHDSNWWIFGISTHPFEQTKKYFENKNIYYMVTCVDTSFIRKYKVAGVPQTLIISGNGMIEKMYNGLLNQDQVNEIEKLINAERY